MLVGDCRWSLPQAGRLMLGADVEGDPSPKDIISLCAMPLENIVEGFELKGA
jgi:hypothetical protein